MEHQNYPAMPLKDEPNEKYEQTITQMREWLSKIYPPSQVDRALYIEKVQSPEEELRIRTKIWTFSNEYTIVVYVGKESNYLGCVAGSRKSRTGEDWYRGNDLADGKFSEETWQRILRDIVRYEAEEIKCEKWKKPT